MEMYSLIPLFVSIGAALTGTAFSISRAALKNPDVSWRPKSNQEPWNSMVDDDGKNKRYKLFNAVDNMTEYRVKAFPDERPPIEKMWAEYQKQR